MGAALPRANGEETKNTFWLETALTEVRLHTPSRAKTKQDTEVRREGKRGMDLRHGAV